MNHTETIHAHRRPFLHSSFVILSFVISLSVLVSAETPPAAVTPYTFIGRVMDAQHVAFGSNRVAKVAASTTDGDLLSRTTTFFRADSRRNYALQIPMATGEVDGYAVQNATLDITVTDDLGKVWRGVVVDAAAGVPGGIREVDIVLGEDANGDGIDDSLYARLKAEWEDSDYWSADEEFDPHKDYDGDGVSAIAEALAGTNPFDPEDALRITAFSQQSGQRSRAEGQAPMALTFGAIGGHAYSVEEASDLSAGDWKAREFLLPGADVPVNHISIPSEAGATSSTIYLLPSSPRAFFRVRAE